MTRIEFPSDYHPLAPVIRQLRSSLKWLDESGVPIQSSQVNALLQRLSQLPKTRVKDQRAIQIAQYWQQVPFATPELDSRYSSVHSSPTSPHNRDSKAVLSSTLPSKAKVQEGPLPTGQFPAVLHQRVVVESISFEQAPPVNTEMEGSAELMTPSQKLSLHKGLTQDYSKQSAEIIAEHSSPNLSPNAPADTSSSFFSKPIDSQSNEVVLDTPAKNKNEQLWATRPAAATPSEPPQISPKKHEAFAKLQLNKPPSPKVSKPSSLELPSASTPTNSPLAHMRRTHFDHDQMFGEICDRVWSCQNCPRHTTNHLISSGHYGAQIMFVVAYASEQDLNTGHLLMDPQERALFNGLLRAMSLSRMEICLTSLMKCGSTEPKPAEWASCQNHFLDELQLVKPKVIVSLGYMASVMLLGDHARQGVWNRYQEIDVMPTFHPTDIIKGGDTTKRNFWNHLKLVMRKAGLQSSKR